MTSEALKTKTKDEVLFMLGSKLGFAEKLKNRLQILTSVSEIPQVDPGFAQDPQNSLKFSTADTTVVVYCSRIEDKDVVICIYRDNRSATRDTSTAWGETNSGEAGIFNSSIGICMSQDVDGASPIAVIGGRVPKIEPLKVFVANNKKFAELVEKMQETVEFGNATQGKKEISSGPTTDLKF